MCYDIKASLEAQLKRARQYGDEIAIREIEEKLAPLTDLPIYHASGFQHPRLLIYTEDDPVMPRVATWGLVPHWVRDHAQQKKIWNNTLNARGETIFEKPAFRTAARYHRCLIFVDGFYEHHHFRGKTYPYFISMKDGRPLIFAGLWNPWLDPETGDYVNTFSIVTTEGNSMMARIHNNPKLEGPRMPLILDEEWAQKWLAEIEEELDVKAIQELIHPYPEEALQARTVHKIRGKEYPGNVPEISEEVVYPELQE
ncbi:Putative SOS response-associated peptidase YedK [Muriicola jejuensis]|uniref:Abasic site processing protein n=1 Tax=Muriicola jejuensis TaxID=504488 RepID=A0A6P0UBU6_9FLAO|nr:SOS response-associated peptidase [Muriicola jejuensis]NER10761.1 SOS response-associated peptidase [Muriicola jejuensis]SMP16377.1 Putative SOS response-associated peptidase YedK [Muriicola jejuensis]